jgi:DNA-binding SARP family transcriptional activator
MCDWSSDVCSSDLRAAALRTYDRCVVLLSDELDIDPMPETQRVAKRIEAGEPVEA